MIDILIVIINYRTPAMLLDCLGSVLEEIANISADVVVVDNASADDSLILLEEWLEINDADSRVSILPSLENLGFSGGNNLGIRSKESNYCLLLNSDTLVRQGAIQTLLDTASKNRDAGLITPRLEWSDGSSQESCFRFISPLSELISSAQTGFITKLLSKYNVPIPVSVKPSMPDWSSFACVLVRKEVFDDIGLMDDGYFMYFEDAEFCHRAGLAGWNVLNEPSARVVHLRGGSSPVKENSKLRKRLPRYYYESRTRYFYQVYGWTGLTVANCLWTLGRVISKTIQICTHRNKSMSHRQWLDIWTNWLNPLKPYTHPDNYK